MCNYFRRMASVLCCMLLLITSLSGCNGVPDNAKDMLSKVYKNMAEVDSYYMDSKLVMETSMQGTLTTTTVDTTVGMTKNPFELSIIYHGQVGEQEPDTTYMYIKQGDTLRTYYYENNVWNETNVAEDQIDELKDRYSTPLDFGLYFNEVDSFTITSSDDEVIVLEGAVSDYNMVNVLKQTGVLKQLSLTTFPEVQLKDAKPIKVTSWVDPDTLCINKVVLDMTGTYQDLANLLFGEDSIVCPQINQCMMEMNNIKINTDYEVIMPDDVKAALDQLRQG